MLQILTNVHRRDLDRIYHARISNSPDTSQVIADILQAELRKSGLDHNSQQINIGPYAINASLDEEKNLIFHVNSTDKSDLTSTVLENDAGQFIGYRFTNKKAGQYHMNKPMI